MGGCSIGASEGIMMTIWQLFAGLVVFVIHAIFDSGKKGR